MSSIIEFVRAHIGKKLNGFATSDADFYAGLEARLSGLEAAPTSVEAGAVPDGWIVQCKDGRFGRVYKTEQDAYEARQLDSAAIRPVFIGSAPTPPASAEQHADDQSIDRFSEAMKVKMAKARAKGRSGWNDSEVCSDQFLASQLITHLGKGNAGTFEDVANFAMMLHQRGANPAILEAASFGLRSASAGGLDKEQEKV